MHHVGLSHSETYRNSSLLASAIRPRALQRWVSLVNGAPEPCLVVDRGGTIAGCSPSSVTLLQLPEPADAVGRALLDGLLVPVDFTAAGRGLSEWELAHLPPLLSLTTGGLARGLIRLRTGQAIRTIDAVSTPLLDGTEVVGSLTFFREI